MMHGPEKPPCDHHASQQAPSDSDSAVFESTAIATLPDCDMLSEAEAARLIRKIDWHVLPMLFLIYVVAFLDRSNISNALTMSMPKELGLTGQQPNIALAVFFVPYIVFEIPSNILMKKLSPHVWLSLCVLGFGVTELCQGFIQNYSGLLATRFFLGVFEAGIFPGSFYLISFWYKRDEAQKRFTVYFCSVILSSAFGGLLASAIARMDGLQGKSNWRWIFILEGILTIMVSVMSFFFVSDFPDKASWLSAAEKQAVLCRTRAQDTQLEGKITRRDIVDFFCDLKNYLGAIMYFSVVVPVYAFAYFTPTIVKSLGYDVLQTQLRSVPPFAAALGLCLVLAYFSDRTDLRLPYVLIPGAVLITGLAILITTHANFSLQYAGICLGRKLFISATVILLNFNVTLGSSLPSGAASTLNSHFGITAELQKPLPVAVFLVGYIFGPIIFAPMSESWGRRPAFLISFSIYTAFTFGCALAPSWPAFLFFRFMLGCGAAAPQTVSGGLFCDIYPDLRPRGMAVTLLGLTSNVGPLVGPILSGFTSTQVWQWQFWSALILAGINWPMLLVMPETFAPVLKARSIQNMAANASLHQPATPVVEKTPYSLRKQVRILARPVRLLSEPLVFFTDLFILYQYIIFFLYFGAYPVIFRGTYAMSEGISALMFIPTGIGAVLAIGVFVAWDRFHSRSIQRGKRWAQQEEYRRLPLACIGGPLFALSEFWLGWTARPSIPWAVPALSGIPLGIGIDLTFMALNNYLTDVYGIYSASALASSVFTRNVLAAIVIPLTTYPLYDNLGTKWACTLLGGLCVLLTPISFAFIRWGPVLRTRSPFCQKLAQTEVAQHRGNSEAPC
ncbi:hypothetical protein ED733_000791 [Metarhizium rileyi]|uniref:Major facilitator superfamily (MFS) profile domain-containing protein n=1 Tax=Metarhizium rileyi (strain RCEF 4871) TaxID=1649241 RepID=A0A5C6FY10_METRR|nr:hypothetical protein ED733_000791 [Metarhizium rileyi]